MLDLRRLRVPSDRNEARANPTALPPPLVTATLPFESVVEFINAISSKRATDLRKFSS